MNEGVNFILVPENAKRSFLVKIYLNSFESQKSSVIDSRRRLMAYFHSLSSFLGISLSFLLLLLLLLFSFFFGYKKKNLYLPFLFTVHHLDRGKRYFK